MCTAWMRCGRGYPTRRLAGFEVGRRRKAGQGHGDDDKQRQADAGQAGERLAAVQRGRHFQRRFPGVADGRPGQQTRQNETASEE